MWHHPQPCIPFPLSQARHIPDILQTVEPDMVLSLAISTLSSISQISIPSLFTRPPSYLTNSDLEQGMLYEYQHLSTQPALLGAARLYQGTERGEAGCSLRTAWDADPCCLYGPDSGISCPVTQLPPALLDPGSGSSIPIFLSFHPLSRPVFISALCCCYRKQSPDVLWLGVGHEGRAWVLKVVRQHLQRSEPVGGLAEPGPGRETGKGGSWRGLGGAGPASPN